ncbi:RNA recognition domain-containing protein [Xylaria flabelliformis]|nr:RNA recognition domain-containing protein [Xylaria flabelliformis]
MTNNPQLFSWAAADLDPLSPAPVHPPSPIVVPALQDQADTYLNMSSISGNLMTSGGVPSAGALKANEQSHVPSITVHSNNNATTDAMDPRHVDLGKTYPDEAVNNVAEKAGTVSIGIHAENMQDSETSQLNATEAEQDVSKSSESTHNSDTVHPVSDRVNVAASAHETCPPISQTSPDAASVSCPSAISQPSHKLPEESQTVLDAVVSNVDNTQLSQSLREQPPANNNHHSGITSHAGYPASNIQALVDNITARAVDADADATHIPISEGTSSSMVLPQNSVLPPKPPVVPGPFFTQPYPAADEFPSPIPGVPQSSSMPLPLSNGLALGNYTGAIPGMVNSHPSGMVVPALSSVPNYQATSAFQSDSTYRSSSVDQLSSVEHQKKRWEAFLQDERKYVSEAKWDRFPEGSRIFIGNLSSERVSKKEVFNIFSKYGRLAQISLKQAYGFVQYHTIAEGQAAMDHLQGIDIRGKKINLEFSRAQKKDGEGSRSSRAKRDNDRQDVNRGRRDDYRPGRQTSPRRSDRRLPSYDGNVRGRSFRESSYSSDRRRSQSPGYSSRDSYRRRSPSPYARYTPSVELDLPRRYGPEVPDVQFLLLQDVKRDFISWAQNAFVNQGLKVDVIFLNPQFPRDAVIQRQVMEGVHAVTELDFRAQEYGKIPLQVFDRSAGYHNVRFDQYQDLDPAIAAQLVARTKSQSQILPPSYHGSQYLPTQQYPPSTQGQYMPPSYPSQPYPSLAAPGPGGAPLDSATVHKILGSLNGQPSRQPPYSGGPPVDVNSLLATIGNHPHAPPSAQQSMGYAHPHPDMSRGSPHGTNSARHVQDIMTQLARYRQ